MNRDQQIPAFEAAIENSWPPSKWQDLTVLIAVSGGADSVALLMAMAAIRSRVEHRLSIKGGIEVGHFNHGWRKEDARIDSEFISTLCERLNILCHIGDAKETLEKEEAARNQRYAFLQSTAEKRGARYIATAHTEDDQAETILHRILRGTGLRGLRGIPKSRLLSPAVTLIRPMLHVSRTAVENYLSDRQQPYRTDSTNADTRFTRNRIRHELLPQLTQQYNSATPQSLLRLARVAEDACDYVSHEVLNCLRVCTLSNTIQGVTLDRAKFANCHVFLQREALVSLWEQHQWPLQSMGFEQWHQVISAVHSGDSSDLPGGIRVSTDGDSIRIERTRPTS